MCTLQQTPRRNHAARIDFKAYAEARLAGNYVVIYNDPEEVYSHSGQAVETAEEVCSRSRNLQAVEVVEEVYSHSLQDVEEVLIGTARNKKFPEWLLSTEHPKEELFLNVNAIHCRGAP